MIVVGYRANADFAEAQIAIRKHTGSSHSEAKKIVENVRSGKGVKLPDDFVLRADLEDLNFLVQ
jgi:hypothetical protein